MINAYLTILGYVACCTPRPGWDPGGPSMQATIEHNIALNWDDMEKIGYRVYIWLRACPHELSPSAPRAGAGKLLKDPPLGLALTGRTRQRGSGGGGGGRHGHPSTLRLASRSPARATS